MKPRDAGWKDLLLNVVTGGGKTTIIAAIMAYLRVIYAYVMKRGHFSFYLRIRLFASV